MTSTRRDDASAGGPFFVTGLRCLRCGRAAPAGPPAVCSNCGGNLAVEYDLARIASGPLSRESLARDPDRTLWRYGALLPVAGRLEGPPVGGSPLVEAPRLARALGLAALFVKDDGRNPSASLKDRASAVALQHARELGHGEVLAASTGNAASATAVLAAAAGMRARIFVPRTAPRAKLAQLLTFGAEVYAVDGTYDQAFDLCLEATRRFGGYNRNTGFNPYTREGKKTVAFEICEQLGWRVPDLVAVPVGDGNILSAVWKGFVEFHRLGLIDRTPRLLAVQAGASDAVVRALEQGDAVPRAVSGETVADSISVSFPRDGEAAVQAVRASAGFGVRVSDEAVLAAIPALARGAGVFGEPAAAASLAGLQAAAAAGRLDPSWTAVALCTGNGLKDVAAALRTAGEPRVIPPDPAVLQDLFSRAGG